MEILTHELTPESLAKFSVDDSLQVYNSLDCMVTLEILEELLTLPADPQVDLIYGFERGLQAPVLEMMSRGFLIDQTERSQGIKKIEAKLARLDFILTQLSMAVWGRPLNPRSPAQLKALFYTHMGLPEKWISQKGERKLSMNREVLEKLEIYFHARPIIATILAYREWAKKLEVLRTDVDSDGRMRTSYNIAGTETGRWSSSTSAFGTGTNLQNITPELRRIFVADYGYKLCVIDLEQAESRLVGWIIGVLFGDWGYLDACESGDLHTSVAKLIWKNLGWGKSNHPDGDRAIADLTFYRDFTYRDMAKRGGHGTNYYGTPFTMARHLKVVTELIENFQAAYFEAFPGIPKWHRRVAETIQRSGVMVSQTGRQRHFLGRSHDDTTLREAIAYDPQGSVGDIMNTGLYTLWRAMPDIQLIGQVHDAVIFQYPESADECQIISQALSLIQIPLTHPSTQRTLVIPGEAKVGWNWGYHHNDKKPTGPGNEFNPNGLRKWKGKPDERRRLVGLDRPIS